MKSGLRDPAEPPQLLPMLSTDIWIRRKTNHYFYEVFAKQEIIKTSLEFVADFGNFVKEKNQSESYFKSAEFSTVRERTETRVQ
jgi:hypothetical protein